MQCIGQYLTILLQSTYLCAEENENEPTPPVNSRLITRSSLKRAERTLFSFSHSKKTDDQFLLMLFTNNCKTLLQVCIRLLWCTSAENCKRWPPLVLTSYTYWHRKRNYGYVKWQLGLVLHSCWTKVLTYLLIHTHTIPIYAATVMDDWVIMTTDDPDVLRRKL